MIAFVFFMRWSLYFFTQWLIRFFGNIALLAQLSYYIIKKIYTFEKNSWWLLATSRRLAAFDRRSFAAFCAVFLSHGWISPRGHQRFDIILICHGDFHSHWDMPPHFPLLMDGFACIFFIKIMAFRVVNNCTPVTTFIYCSWEFCIWLIIILVSSCIHLQSILNSLLRYSELSE